MLKIVYAGTPEFATPALKALAGSQHQLLGVYTQPDRPSGRGRTLQTSAVKQMANELGIPVYQPLNFRQENEVARFRELRADLMVVAAYGLMLPADVLQTPTYGCINIHASLLPRWRGAAPIQRAILAGDRETGITIMQMDEGLDTGMMLAKSKISIGNDWSAGELHDELMLLGADLLMSTIDKLEQGGLTPEVQDEAQATYAKKLVKSEAEIDWSNDAADILRQIRAYSPWPVSFSSLDGQVVRFWRATASTELSNKAPGSIIRHDKNALSVQCGTGVLCVSELQFAGKKRCHARQLLGGKNLTGSSFG